MANSEGSRDCPVQKIFSEQLIIARPAGKQAHESSMCSCCVGMTASNPASKARRDTGESAQAPVSDHAVHLGERVGLAEPTAPVAQSKYVPLSSALAVRTGTVAVLDGAYCSARSLVVWLSLGVRHQRFVLLARLLGRSGTALGEARINHAGWAKVPANRGH